MERAGLVFRLLVERGDSRTGQGESQRALVIDVRSYGPSPKEDEQGDGDANGDGKGSRNGQTPGGTQEPTSISTGNTMLLP